MKKIFAQLFLYLAFVCTIQAQSLGNTSYWKIFDSNSIIWDVKSETHLPHGDNIEMSGLKISFIVNYNVDKEKNLTIDRKIIWPMLRRNIGKDEPQENQFRAYLVRYYVDSILPKIEVNGKEVLLNKVDSIKIDGTISFIRHMPNGLRITRILFPSRDKELAVEKWVLENTSKDPISIVVKPIKTVEEITGYYGKYVIESRSDKIKKANLNFGKSLSLGIYFTARKDTAPEFELNAKKELASREAYLELIRNNLVLETPDKEMNLAFLFAKTRTAESVFKTKIGLVHSPGGNQYYGGIWANDQIEYSAPFLPLLGYQTVNEAEINALRIFDESRTSDFSPIYSSHEMEGDITCCGKDRGDAAMLAYGSSRFLMELGDKKIAEYYWHSIEWYLEYCYRKTTKDGVISSASDELEGRLGSTSTANLSTSCITYGALNAAADLGLSLKKNGQLIETYRIRAEELRLSIEKYFGRIVDGINAYRYYDGSTGFRNWECMPLVVDINERKDGVIKALYTKLWMPEGILTQSGDSTFWDHGTEYSLMGTFKCGEPDTAFKYLKIYTSNRLLGSHVPYAIEAWPEGGEAHLAAESALYGRIFTEGVFGITPTGLNSFLCKPSMPKDWNNITLKKIHAFNRVFDLDVIRIDEKYIIQVLKEGKKINEQVVPEGESAKIIFGNN
jgi:hypothetical protein